MFDKHRFVGSIYIVVANHKACVYWGDSLGFVFAVNSFVEILKEYFIEFANGHHNLVVALHKLLNTQSFWAVFIAEHHCQFALIIKQQALFWTIGQQVQAVAHFPQELLIAAHRGVLFFRQEPFGD